MAMPLAITGNIFEASWESAAAEERRKQGIEDDDPNKPLTLLRAAQQAFDTRGGRGGE